jgi:hypothetical protein
MDASAMHADLCDPAAYPGAVHRVETIETHISRLYLADERVYKVKKPVRFAFLDFSTPELRERFCHEEVRLNRRLAPDVYLGVVPIFHGADGRFTFRDEGGAVADHAVCMRRLPAHRMLDALLARGALDNALLERLAETLARFHAEAEAGPEIARHGTPDAVRGLVVGNVDELAPFVGAALSPRLHAHLRASAERFLDRQRKLLERRVAAGRIRDGHGDLHASNVCALEDGRLAIYDCIEFNPALRAGDVACDLAFLAMDLDHRGFPGFAGVLGHWYAAEAEDPELERLLSFYKAYRACVRAKVALLGAPESGEGRTDALARAADYLHLAVGYDLPPPVLVLAGDGKAAHAVAAALQRALRARVLDAASPALADLPHTLRGERAAVITLPSRVAPLEAALADAAARLGRPHLQRNAAELAAMDPTVMTAGVIEDLLSA